MSRVGSVVAFVSQSGDQGKSILAQALSVYCASNGLSTTLVDLDIEHRSSVKWGHDRVSDGLEPNVNVLACDTLEESLIQYKDEDMYILDTPSRASDATFTAFNNSDLVVFVTTPDEKNLELTLATIHRLLSQGADIDKVLVCLNRFTLPSSKKTVKREVQEVRDYLKEFEFEGRNIKVCGQLIPEKVGYKLAFKERKTILETNYNSLNRYAANVIEAIIEEVFDEE